MQHTTTDEEAARMGRTALIIIASAIVGIIAVILLGWGAYEFLHAHLG